MATRPARALGGPFFGNRQDATGGGGASACGLIPLKAIQGIAAQIPP